MEIYQDGLVSVVFTTESTFTAYFIVHTPNVSIPALQIYNYVPPLLISRFVMVGQTTKKDAFDFALFSGDVFSTF